jgi:hypothetical protein
LLQHAPQPMRLTVPLDTSGALLEGLHCLAASCPLSIRNQFCWKTTSREFMGRAQAESMGPQEFAKFNGAQSSSHPGQLQDRSMPVPRAPNRQRQIENPGVQDLNTNALHSSIPFDTSQLAGFTSERDYSSLVRHFRVPFERAFSRQPGSSRR